VGVHDALGAPGRAGGVVDRDHLLFIDQWALKRLRGAGGEKVLIGVAGRAGVIHPHDVYVAALDEPDELMVAEHDPRAGVLEDIGDLARRQAGVDRHQHRARRRHGEVRLQQRRDVGTQERYAVAGLDACAGQRRRQPVHAVVELAVAVATLAVHHRHLVGVDEGAAPQEAHRRELGPIDLLGRRRCGDGNGHGGLRSDR
jgi:hypothetical protein